VKSSSIFIITRRLITERKLTPPLVLFFLGYVFLMFPYFTDLTLEQLLKDTGPKYLGYALTILGGAWLYLEFFSAYFKNKREESFSDVDARRREREQTSESRRILDEIKELKHNQQSIDYEKIEELVKESSTLKEKAKEKKFESFEHYFDSLSSLLEEQAQTADEKASILLDKGTAYSRNGIIFFISTIIIWQIVTAFYGFQTQHIYGIVSCSVLFVFIEFLSAWFLKQYRHYVDTSTYLLKVKSIFDRYMLSYLAITKSGADKPEQINSLTSLLSEDIKWPESYLMKNPDISFAKEAFETMSHFAKTMKSEAKNTNSSKSNT
jgi:hypothetical protein